MICEECNGTGLNLDGSTCPYCDGRGYNIIKVKL